MTRLESSFLSVGSIQYGYGDLAGAEALWLETWRIAPPDNPSTRKIASKTAVLLAVCYDRWALTDQTKAAVASEWKRRVGTTIYPNPTTPTTSTNPSK